MAKINTTLYGELAFLPEIAEIPVTETLSFLTDSIIHYDGTEQNIQLRSKPRQKFEYSIPIKYKDNADLFNTLSGAIRQKWAVPNWTDLQSVGTINSGDTSIVCNTVDYDLRDDSLAMIFTNCDNYKVIEITSLTSSNITLSSAIASNIRNAYLVPIRIGYINGSVSRSINGYNGKLNLNFEVLDLKEFTTSAPTQYLSNDIYYDENLLSSNFAETDISKREDIIDFDLGIVDRRSPWTASKFGRTYRSLTVLPTERTNFRNFILRRYGKFRPFWMPSFENNLIIKNTGVVVSTLVTYLDSYIDYANNRIHVAIQSNGLWYPRIISSPTQTDSDTVQYTLDTALNLPSESITRVSYLSLYRLDADNIEFNYNSPLSVETSVRILEIQS